MAEAKAKETNVQTIKDVIFMYSSVSRPVEQLNTDKKPPISAPTSPTFDLEFHSYEIKILISEERYKGIKKTFKGAKNLPNAKEFTKEELLENVALFKLPQLSRSSIFGTDKFYSKVKEYELTGLKFELVYSTL